MGFFREWIQNVVVFLLFTEIAGQLVPDGKYRKYVRLSVGLILILVLIMPITKFLGMDEEIFRNYIRESMKVSAEDARSGGKLFNAEEKLAGEYKNIIKEEIRVYFESDAMIVKYCSMDINDDPDSEEYGKIYSMQIGILPKDLYMEETSGVESVEIPEVRIGKAVDETDEEVYIPEEKMNQWKQDLMLQFGMEEETLELVILS